VAFGLLNLEKRMKVYQFSYVFILALVIGNVQSTWAEEAYDAVKPHVQACGKTYDQCRESCGIECMESCAHQLKECLDKVLGPQPELDPPDIIQG